MKSILAAVGAVKRWIKEVPSGGRGARVVSDGVALVLSTSTLHKIPFIIV
jgi:hypothetical protein